MGDGRGHSGQHGIGPGETAIGVIIGRTSEFFDFFVFAIASVLVFPRHVFPFVDPVTGTLYSFGFFAIAFLARPFGTALFMKIDRAHGRGVKLTTALFTLGTSTAGMAFLPSYETIGIAAPILLALFRIGQGLAMGGVWDGLASLLSVNVDPKRRGWYAMIPQLGAPLGLVVASGLFAYFYGNLTRADFYDWGWRYPFFVAMAINVVALFARLRIVVTEEYQNQFEARHLQPTPIFQTIREEGMTIVLGAFVPLASFALFHMVTVFPLSWVFLYTEESISHFLVIEMIGALFGVAAMVVGGWLSDRHGRQLMLGATALAIAIFSGFAPLLLNGGDIGELAFMIIGFSILGLCFGQASGSVASNFGVKNRYTASALTSDFAWLLGAGFAPLAALSLASAFGLGASGGYLLSGAVCTLIALYVSYQKRGQLD
ncbi:MAG: MFS transporter [Rhodobacteraceae bacterium]|nr:MFS transporter [Paracoccaceae bacterium]